MTIKLKIRFSILKIFKTLLLLIALAFVAVIIWIGTSLAIYFFYTNIVMVKHIKGEPPPLFPVLVIVTGKNQGAQEARIVHWHYLKASGKERGFSFEAPKVEVEKIRKLLNEAAGKNVRKFDSSCDPNILTGMHFKVIKTDGSGQRLRALGSYCYGKETTGWYTVKNNEIYPEKYRDNVDEVELGLFMAKITPAWNN